MVQARQNLEGYMAGGRFHPIRSSKDYAYFMAGEHVPQTTRKRDPFGRGGRKSSRASSDSHLSLAQLKKIPHEELSLSDFVRRIGGMNRPRKGEEGFGVIDPKGNYNWLFRTESERDRNHIPEYVMDSANDEGFRNADGEKWTSAESFLDDVLFDRAAAKDKEKFWSINKEYDVEAAEREYYSSKNPAAQSAFEFGGAAPASSSGAFFTESDVASARKAEKVLSDPLKGLAVQVRETGKKGTIRNSLLNRTTGKRLVEVEFPRKKESEFFELEAVNLLNPYSLRGVKRVLGSAAVNQYLASPRVYAQLAQAYDLARRDGDGRRMAALELLSLMLREHDAHQFRLARRSSRNGAAFYNSINDIRRANRAGGGRFFAPSSLRGLHTIVFPEVYGGAYFITSDTPDRETPRRFTLRRAGAGGAIFTTGKLRGHISKEGATRAAQLLSTKKNPAGALIAELMPHILGGAAAGVAGEAAGHYLRQRRERENRTNGGGAPAPINELSQMFQGQVSGEVLDLLVSKQNAGKKLARLGNLTGIRLEIPARGCAARIEKNPFHVCQRCGVKFNPRTAVVAMDSKKKLHLCGEGVRFRKPRNVNNPETVEVRGPIEYIAYITAKAHIGGGQPFNYGHHFSELTGKVEDMPQLGIDMDGMPLILDGDYDITEDGIVN